jgi:nicotinamidase-related amidase
MADNQLELDPTRTALVVIDLQRGIAGRETAPHTGPQVVANAAKLADRFRELGGFVVLVRVSSMDGKDRLQHPTDAPMMGSASFPEGFDIIVDELGPKKGDLVVTKHQWGAFYGTELDLQLRRRGISTIVLCGISTNMGVESTARDAYEHNYALVLVEDAMAALSGEAHAFAITHIFPRIGRVRSTEQVLGAL